MAARTPTGVGPRKAVVTRMAYTDVLECGHELPANYNSATNKRHLLKKRACPRCLAHDLDKALRQLHADAHLS